MGSNNSPNYGFNTICVRSGYQPGKGEPVVPPIVASSTYRYETTEQVHELFDLQEQGFFYSRIDNPTVAVVEKRVAELEGGVGALMTSSGQAATLLTILNIAGAGDHLVATQSMYGGSINLMQHRLSNLGIATTFLDNDVSAEELASAIQPNTVALFGETLSNPTLRLLDIPRWAQVAHKHHLPLIIDNTFPTPYFCRPFQLGADIVTHSSTKYLDGHALQISGLIVDSGNFDWKLAYQTHGHFAGLIEPDVSYKGISYVNFFGKIAFIVKARTQLMRDFGSTASPFSAFLLGNGLQTLSLRMQRHYENALQIATVLERHQQVASVNFPALPGNRYHKLAQQILPNGCSGVLSFIVKGANPEAERANAGRVINALKLINIEVNVAEIRSCMLHPATSTHRQMSIEELQLAGIEPGLLRLSVGLEDVADIQADLLQALAVLE
ncbi:MAG: O-acetylhomoserine aminocarboxypropyltransferase/cysteine synthase [Bifidobacteriaceae bacterium]|jgi:O-acetylhomoserine (thiol)-lyase|nr:O-acetylhomoserine aminocarboxypropyltransferase/cysteine synthase [Bifidobacteriaceae bacterium]